MRYLVTMSRDGIDIDAEITLEADTEPGFWDLYDLAAAHDCDFWSSYPID